MAADGNCDRIHIFGASGSGTTTLAAAIAHRFGHTHLDVDEFFWEKTEPPFITQREVNLRRAMLAQALDAHPHWVLSGSLTGWGDVFIPRFQLAVFLYLPNEIRMQRLLAREDERYGPQKIGPGGAMHQQHLEFIEWARAYDSAGAEQRSRFVHENWIRDLNCRVLRLEGPMTTEQQIAQIEPLLRHNRPAR